MRIFLLWRSIGDKGAALAAEDVTAKLQKVFAPLFGTPLMQTVHQNPGMALVLLELPVQRWKPPFVQEDEHTWALAVDYPINGRTVLAANGVSFSEDNFLPALCHRLQTEPRTLLKDLAPPFSLVWTSKQTGETYVQNDGLGQSQLFEFQDEHLWALSNKITAFKALGVSLVPEPEQWAVWATVGWFPLEMSGYKNIRFLAPATRLRLTAEGLSRTSHDVLSDWVHPQKMTPTDCLELARCSLLNLIEGCESLWMKPSAGLSGGWDSRAVVASLRKVSVDFSARVRGLPGSHDVVIATELARIAGMRLKVQAGGLPPEAANSCRRSIELALLWQSGHLNGYRHKTFLAHQPCLEPRPVSVTGQHGEIGRRERMFSDEYQPEKIGDAQFSNQQHEDCIVGALIKDMPPFTRPRMQERLGATIRQAVRQADRYDLAGLARVDFFGLYEFTRRKGSAVHAYQSRLLIAPFLNPDYIRAAFGYLDRSDTNVFPRHIIQINAPEWAGVPYYEDREQQQTESTGASPNRPLEARVATGANWKQPLGRRQYDGSRYWQTVGKPLLDEAFAHGGLWTEIFDPDLAKQHWPASPDALAVIYMLPHVLEGI